MSHHFTTTELHNSNYLEPFEGDGGIKVLMTCEKKFLGRMKRFVLHLMKELDWAVIGRDYDSGRSQGMSRVLLD